jgi:dihydrodipicolinate synthase/N-acetylneuraminate lyase
LEKPRGIIPAVATAVNGSTGEINESDQKSIVRFCLKSRVNGIAAAIIVGEFYKFTDDERRHIVSIVVDEANGKVPVWAGVTHFSTEPCVSLAKSVKDLGADGIIAMPGLLGKANSAEDLYDHFATLLKRVDIPLMIQDSEDFNGIRIPASVYQKLANEFSHLVSAKVEGGNTFEKISELRELLGDRLSLIGGMEARQLLEELAAGTSGNISDVCFPDLLVQVYESYVAGDQARADRLFEEYRPWVEFLILHSGSIIETEKQTLKFRGIIKDASLRRPFHPLDDKSLARLSGIVSNIENSLMKS